MAQNIYCSETPELYMNFVKFRISRNTTNEFGSHHSSGQYILLCIPPPPPQTEYIKSPDLAIFQEKTKTLAEANVLTILQAIFSFSSFSLVPSSSISTSSFSR
jgi:hypothetical protein